MYLVIIDSQERRFDQLTLSLADPEEVLHGYLIVFIEYRVLLSNLIIKHIC